MDTPADYNAKSSEYYQRWIISYALLESAIWPDFHTKSSRSHKAEPSGIWMTEGG